MVDTQKVKEHLENGGTVVVDDLWYFTGLGMACYCTLESGIECCSEYYEDYQEAANAILDYSDSQEDEIRYV